MNAKKFRIDDTTKTYLSIAVIVAWIFLAHHVNNPLLMVLAGLAALLVLNWLTKTDESEGGDGEE